MGTDRDMTMVAQKARRRVYGLSEKDAAQKEGGYLLGRLYIAGFIKKHHLEAGNRMAEDFGRYYGLTGIPFPSARAQNLFRVKGLGADSDPEAARKAANRVMELEGVLGAADVSGRPVTSTVKRVCLMDEGDGIFHEHMIAHLLRGLESLVDFFGIEREK